MITKLANSEVKKGVLVWGLVILSILGSVFPAFGLSFSLHDTLHQAIEDTDKLEAAKMAGYKPTALGIASPIITWEYDQIQPALAYNNQTDEYLVVWEDHHWGWGNDWDIYARRLDHNGVTLGNYFGISWEGSNHRLAPEVAYNDHDNEFLVVWECEYTAADHDIYARRVASNGTLIGGEIPLATLTQNESNPDVAYNAIDNEYLIVWERREGSGAGSHVDIYGQRRAADGTSLGEPVLIGYGLQDQLAPSVALGSTNHEYLVVWQDNIVQLASEEVVMSTQFEFDIFGQRVGANGSLVGDQLTISTWEYDQVKPRLAFNAGANEFLVVWEDHHWGWGDDWDIYGQRVNANGALVGDNFAISWEGANHRERPDVAYHPTVNEYMIVWEYDYSADDHDVYCRRISSDGTLREAELGVSRLGSSEGRPAIAAGDNQSYFFVWEDGRDAATQGINLYGELMELTLFSGYVYVGEIGDESAPLGGVTVELYCSNDAGALGTLVATATTTDAGRYGLPVSGVYEYYNLVETDPAGYTSVGATSIGGTVISSNQIQYTPPLESKTLSDNKFWDLPPATMPDLIVTDVWNDESAICYQIRNVGDAVAPEGHRTALVVDDEYIVSDLVTTALEPGARWKGCFDYVWTCSPLSDSILVKADNRSQVAERNETNNLREEFWKCDTTPPQIIAGPVVKGTTQDLAVIDWETDEESDSVVRYGKTARIYTLDVDDSTPVTSHSLTLRGLEPSTTYHVKVHSTDGSGNTAESNDMTFETAPLPDNVPPTVSLNDPGIYRETVTIMATASDNVGVERVEFYLDNVLLLTSYSPPYTLPLDTTLYANGSHLLIAKAFDRAGRFSLNERNITVVNIKDFTNPQVTFISPAPWATVSGVVPVEVYVSDEEGLAIGSFLVGPDPGWLYYSWLKGYPYPKNATIKIDWNTKGVANGPRRIAWKVYDVYGNIGWGYRDVIVNNSLPPPPPELIITNREIKKNKNYYTVTLTVKNVGGDVATKIEIADPLQLFQPIDKSDSVGTYKSEFNPQSMSSWVKISSKVDIPKGGEQTYSYDVVPILTPESAGPNGWLCANCPMPPMIGNYRICTGTGYIPDAGKTEWWYTQPGQYNHYGSVSLGQQINYFEATTQANYMIATNPSRLFGLNPGKNADVNALLSDMAKLAKLKNGVLGYLSSADYSNVTLRNLIKPGSGWSNANWAYRLHPDFSTPLKGYLLIVGETEIVPAWNIPQPNTGPIHHSDQPYSDTVGSDDRPELVVGRIIGNNATNLSKAIRTSIGIYEGTPGYGFDRSDALVVTGGCGGENAWQDDANEKISLLDDHFSVDKVLCLDYFGLSSFNVGLTEYDGFATGDVLGGAKAEILVADDVSGIVNIFNGTGNKVGSFNSGSTWTGGVAAGDVLGDGKAEILVPDGYWGVVNIFDGSGNKIGSFNGDFMMDDGFAVGDVLGGGKAEILVTDEFLFFGLGVVSVFDAAGNKKGSFIAGFTAGDGFAVGDVLGDGKAQILVADRVSGVVSLFDAAGNKKGSFNGGFTAGDGFALGNVYPDCKAEIFIANKAGQIHVYYYWVDPEGKKESEFRKALFYEGGFTSKDGFALGDVLGDDYCEVLVASDVSGVVQLSEPQCAARLLPVFKNKTPDKDVIFFTGHGNPYGWCSVIDARWDFPVNFGNTSPFVFAATCSSGNYDPDGDYSIGEAFFDSGASVYIGATTPSLDGLDSKRFFENWVNTPKSIGRAFAETEKDVIASIKDYYWVRQYNLYGDPKVGGTASASEASVPSKMASVEEAPSSLEVVVPDYQVTTTDGVDHVELPGGMLLLVEGKPQVPLYSIHLDYPQGYEIQDVLLTERTGLINTTGLDIPNARLIVRDRHSEWQDKAEPTSWYPEEVYDWRTFENPDGTTTLIIIMYPFYYNNLTTDVQFYKNYSFAINYTVSTVGITSLETDKDTYQQGDQVRIDIGLNNSGEPLDVIVDAAVKRYGSHEVVAGLLLRTLQDLAGPASFSPQWASNGFDPDLYHVEVTLRDSSGNVLDSKTRMFRVGISSCEIAALSATPEYFEIGDDIEISMDFKNNGTVNITGSAVIKIFSSTGEVVEEFWHNVTDLMPSESVRFNDTWTTAEAGEGSYTILGYVLYDSKATEPVSVSVSTAPDVFDTGVSSQPYPSNSGTHNGTITPSYNLSVGTLYTYPCAGTGGHTEYVKIWKGGTTIAEKTWSGYLGDWHNLTFNYSFTLYANETYNYTIRTGSYPQIIHASSHNTTGGVITCTSFVDVNGKRHEGWIPAIRLE